MKRWILAASAFLAVPSAANADILTPNETLRVTFTIDNNWTGVAPDVLCMTFGVIMVNAPFTTRTAELYDGATLLGTDSKSSFGGFTGPLSLNPTNSFADANSIWTFKGPEVVDFTSILDGTIQGVIEFTIATGEMDIPLSQVDLWMIRGSGSSSGTVVSPAPIVTSVEITGGAVGTNYCVSTANSTGFASTISASGSTSIGANDLVLSADNLPAQPGIFIAGPTQAQIPFFNGFLCIDQVGLQRFNDTSSPNGGVITEAVDYATSSPGGLNVVAGASYHYQRWNRDPAAGGGNANFSDGIEVVHSP